MVNSQWSTGSMLISMLFWSEKWEHRSHASRARVAYGAGIYLITALWQQDYATLALTFLFFLSLSLSLPTSLGLHVGSTEAKDFTCMLLHNCICHWIYVSCTLWHSDALILFFLLWYRYLILIWYDPDLGIPTVMSNSSDFWLPERNSIEVVALCKFWVVRLLKTKPKTFTRSCLFDCWLL